ncbi:MAG: DUF1127 domain-containing protein [Devosiaceae bacterium]
MTVHNFHDQTRYNTQGHANTPSILPELASIVRRAWAALEDRYQQVQNRRGIHKMLELDDHMLRDMGLTRGDVSRAANLPLSQSAGNELTRISKCQERSV